MTADELRTLAARLQRTHFVMLEPPEVATDDRRRVIEHPGFGNELAAVVLTLADLLDRIGDT